MDQTFDKNARAGALSRSPEEGCLYSYTLITRAMHARRAGLLEIECLMVSEHKIGRSARGQGPVKIGQFVHSIFRFFDDI